MYAEPRPSQTLCPETRSTTLRAQEESTPQHIIAIITPPDIVSQIMVAIPMIALYEISIALSRVVGRARKTAAEAA